MVDRRTVEGRARPLHPVASAVESPDESSDRFPDGHKWRYCAECITHYRPEQAAEHTMHYTVAAPQEDDDHAQD